MKHIPNKQLEVLKILDLKDAGLLLVHRHADEGVLMKLKLVGYLHCKKQSAGKSSLSMQKKIRD